MIESVLPQETKVLLKIRPLCNGLKYFHHLQMIEY